ncbi:hypothetical protein HS960_19995 [Sphingobacterium paramultivorum]|uniref:Lipopolysaccharide biosynthesis protein n=1 Tax=Sphingobacterium paramultivorum TaxID=2886510 RepID=A0A7G5E718_9SPHI|nr:hypothetical protein [Sphingobacterium paramultivorum]QMV69793.1 hypothetical protein HS960_19995 [Sphingobacterium paramultivorum]WSO13620.1 hypothetical protein VUL84_19995 [Sphingobacterium paramultivorum]
MEIDLKNKNILFIGPIFYNYHEIIKAELERLGAKVYFEPERDYTFKFTIVNNFFPGRLNKFQAKHYKRIFNRRNGIEFDYLFVIRGYKMSSGFINSFKKRYPSAKLIMHQWDSENNNSFSHLIGSFDRFFSFDPLDVKKYPALKYLPNFYLEDVHDAKVSAYNYDILFLVSYLPERYEIVSKLKAFASQYNLKLKAILVISFSTYIKEWILGNRLDRDVLKFSPLKRSDYMDLFWQSKMIFDMGSNLQTGMSQRTIETIESGKKLLINNTYIKEEAIFNESQIFVTSNDFSKEIVDFMDKPFDVKPTGYSLENWIKTIFG